MLHRNRGIAESRHRQAWLADRSNVPMPQHRGNFSGSDPAGTACQTKCGQPSCNSKMQAIFLQQRIQDL